MLVRMYTAKERETLVIETHILSFGLFLCPQAFEKSVCGHRLQEEVDTEQLHADGLTMGKGADIFALVSRGHRSDRIPPRESPRHFAASMDESVIVGYYTLKKCLSAAPAVCIPQRKDKKSMARNDGIDRTVARNWIVNTFSDKFF